MRIDEFTSTTITPKFDYDIADDVVVFMRNDPIFYRKSLFPAVSRMADLHRSGKAIDPSKCLGSVVEKALGSYCKKFNIAELPDEVFNLEDRSNIINRLFSEEMEEIKKGEYK